MQEVWLERLGAEGWAQREATGCIVELNVIEPVGSSKFRGSNATRAIT